MKTSFFSKPWSYFLVNPGLISLSLGFRLHSHNRVQPSGVCPEPDEWWGLCRACVSQAPPLPSAAHPQSQVRLVPGLLLPKRLPWELPRMCAWLSSFSHVQLFATSWTVALQTSLSMGFSRLEYWSVLPCPPPGDLPDPTIERASLMSPELAGEFFTTSASWEAQQLQRV